MEMNFPHHEAPFGSVALGVDFRVLLTSAITRQGNSKTARAMQLGMRDVCTDDNRAVGFLDQRIYYFAGSTTLKIQKNPPHGAFYLLNRTKNDAELKCEDVVYQYQTDTFNIRIV
jgi:hypothetical protein